MSDAKKSQVDRFKEAARQLEADDDEERFNEKLKKIARSEREEPEKASSAEDSKRK